MRAKSYAGYRLTARRPASSAAVEHWWAEGPDGLAEVYLGPEMLVRRARALPVWGPFSDILTGREGPRSYVVVRGRLARGVDELRKMLSPGACVAFAWHLASALAEVHDRGGAHGALHPGWTGVDAEGRLSIRPALSAAVRSDPDGDASAQASDCIQLASILDALELERLDESALTLLMRGISRERARLRLQPGRAVRQSLSYVLGRHPEWEASLVDTLGEDWRTNLIPRSVPLPEPVAAHPWVDHGTYIPRVDGAPSAGATATVDVLAASGLAAVTVGGGMASSPANPRGGAVASAMVPGTSAAGPNAAGTPAAAFVGTAQTTGPNLDSVGIKVDVAVVRQAAAPKVTASPKLGVPASLDVSEDVSAAVIPPEVTAPDAPTSTPEEVAESTVVPDWEPGPSEGQEAPEPQASADASEPAVTVAVEADIVAASDGGALAAPAVADAAEASVTSQASVEEVPAAHMGASVLSQLAASIESRPVPSAPPADPAEPLLALVSTESTDDEPSSADEVFEDDEKTAVTSVPEPVKRALERMDAERNLRNLASIEGEPEPIAVSAPVVETVTELAQRPPVLEDDAAPASPSTEDGGDVPRWAGLKGVTGDASREDELGSGKWEENARPLDELRKEMGATPVRPMEEIDPSRGNWPMLIVALGALAGLVALWFATQGNV